jgi:AraC-like DNA-binding protein
MPQLASVFAAPHTVPLGSPTARMLAGMLPRLAASVEEVSADEMPRLDAVLTAILSACLPGWELRPASTRAQLEAARRARVIALVDQMLGSPALTPALLVRRSGLSRSELYRCFTPAGGLARVIQMRRLRHAYAALARADGPGAINRVAETVGFPDPSNFTRAFRREFGCTPTEVVARRLPAAGVPPPGLVAALTAGPG